MNVYVVMFYFLNYGNHKKPFERSMESFHFFYLL